MSKFYDLLKSAEVAVKRKIAASSLYEFQTPVEYRAPSESDTAISKRNISLGASKKGKLSLQKRNGVSLKRELYERLCRGNTRNNEIVNNEVLKKSREAKKDSWEGAKQCTEDVRSFKDILGLFESSCSKLVRQNISPNDLDRPWHTNSMKKDQLEALDERNQFGMQCAQQNPKINEHVVQLEMNVPILKEESKPTTLVEPGTVDKLYERSNVDKINGENESVAGAEIPLRRQTSNISNGKMYAFEERICYGFNEDEQLECFQKHSYGSALVKERSPDRIDGFVRSPRDLWDVNEDEKSRVHVQILCPPENKDPIIGDIQKPNDLQTIECGSACFKNLIESRENSDRSEQGAVKTGQNDGMLFLNVKQCELSKENIQEDNTFKSLCYSMKQNAQAKCRDERTVGMIFLNQLKKDVMTPKTMEDLTSFKHHCAAMKNSPEGQGTCKGSQSSGMLFMDQIKKEFTQNNNEEKMSFQHCCMKKNNKQKAVIAEKSFKTIKDLCEEAKCYGRKSTDGLTPVVENLNNVSTSFKQFACAVMDKCMPKKAVDMKLIGKPIETNVVFSDKPKEASKSAKNVSEIFKETCSNRKRKQCQVTDVRERSVQSCVIEPPAKKLKNTFHEHCSDRCNTAKFQKSKCKVMSIPSAKENVPSCNLKSTVPVGSVKPIKPMVTDHKPERKEQVAEKLCEGLGRKYHTSLSDNKRKKVYEFTKPRKDEQSSMDTLESSCYRLSKMKRIKEIKTKGYSVSKRKSKPPRVMPVSLERDDHESEDLEPIESHYSSPRKSLLPGVNVLTSKLTGVNRVRKGKNSDLLKRLLSLKTGIKAGYSIPKEAFHSGGHPEGLWQNVTVDSMSRRILQYLTDRKC